MGGRCFGSATGIDIPGRMRSSTRIAPTWVPDLSQTGSSSPIFAPSGTMTWTVSSSSKRPPPSSTRPPPKSPPPPKSSSASFGSPTGNTSPGLAPGGTSTSPTWRPSTFTGTTSPGLAPGGTVTSTRTRSSSLVSSAPPPPPPGPPPTLTSMGWPGFASSGHGMAPSTLPSTSTGTGSPGRQPSGMITTTWPGGIRLGSMPSMFELWLCLSSGLSWSCVAYKRVHAPWTRPRRGREGPRRHAQRSPERCRPHRRQRE
mmetsp:Transcript_17596/g.54098  ORF Transcript_17596/g.54098 Transcript_17596/m.54098 type:complete len:257 (-) Transcript_17596:2-772(-)